MDSKDQEGKDYKPPKDVIFWSEQGSHPWVYTSVRLRLKYSDI